MEKSSLFALPVANNVLRSCKRKIGHCDWDDGATGLSATPAAMAGSWMNLRKLTGQELMDTPRSMQDDDAEAKIWKIDTEGLAK